MPNHAHSAKRGHLAEGFTHFCLASNFALSFGSWLEVLALSLCYLRLSGNGEPHPNKLRST